MKRILITNDDGATSIGLGVLSETLSRIARVVVVAPACNKSATSAAITLNRALCVTRKSPDFYTVDGTPADCVHAALTGLLSEKPDLIVSGINCGKNLGEDIVYSGTVGAARVGYLFAVSSLAVSLVSDSWRHVQTAADVSRILISRILQTENLSPFLFNVNVPDLPFKMLCGIKKTRPGLRSSPQRATVQTGADGKFFVSLGSQGNPVDCGSGTDFEAIQNGYVSVSPLKMLPAMTDNEIDFSALM